MRQLREDGEDKVIHHEAIPEEILKQMRDKLNLNNPTQLQQRVFLEVEMHFARRGREGLRSLRKDSFAIRKDENEREFIEMTHLEIEKTKQGVHKDDVAKQARMYAMEGENCPVSIFKKYLS